MEKSFGDLKFFVGRDDFGMYYAGASYGEWVNAQSSVNLKHWGFGSLVDVQFDVARLSYNGMLGPVGLHLALAKPFKSEDSETSEGV